jgi:hypothetical protein
MSLAPRPASETVTEEAGMKDRRNDQQGAQEHAEGEYGDQARERNRERLQESVAETDETDRPSSNRVGKHRLHEDREQHDEADKNSEKNRLARERDEQRAE